MEQQQPGMTISPSSSSVPPEVPSPSPIPTPTVPPSPTTPAPEPPPPAFVAPVPAPTSAVPNQWQPNTTPAVEASAIVPQPVADNPEDSEAVSWTSSEFVAHEKSPGWYAMLAVGAVVLSAIVFLLTQDKISAGVVLVAAAVLGFYAARKPRTLEYKVDDNGITIGAKFYVYDMFKSFSVVDEGPLSGIVLLPLKRFMPQLTMYYAPNDEDRIIHILADRLPMEEHRADMVDSFMRHIKF